LLHKDLDVNSIETMTYDGYKKKLKKVKKVSKKQHLSPLKTRGYNSNRNKHLGLDF
jgi:hypothetical protein